MSYGATRYRAIFIATVLLLALTSALARAHPVREPTDGECARPRPDWIWCDDFEHDRLASYFEYNDGKGSFTRVAGAGRDGSYGMRARFAPHQVDAGALHLALGRTPQPYFRPVDAGTAVYRELYWRFWLRNEPGWTGGGGDKLTRAISFASPTTWAEAMVAHVWSGVKQDADYLVIDPASGTDAAGVLRTTAYNDGPRFRWLGAQRASMPTFDRPHVGAWHCVEAHVRLNTPGASDGVFQLWVDDTLAAERRGLNWVGANDTYGLNAIFLENYWNTGAPVAQARELDDFVVGKNRVGCRAGD